MTLVQTTTALGAVLALAAGALGMWAAPSPDPALLATASALAGGFVVWCAVGAPRAR
jgi:hypothetical protein